MAETTTAATTATITKRTVKNRPSPSPVPVRRDHTPDHELRVRGPFLDHLGLSLFLARQLPAHVRDLQTQKMQVRVKAAKSPDIARDRPFQSRPEPRKRPNNTRAHVRAHPIRPSTKRVPAIKSTTDVGTTAVTVGTSTEAIGTSEAAAIIATEAVITASPVTIGTTTARATAAATATGTSGTSTAAVAAAVIVITVAAAATDRPSMAIGIATDGDNPPSSCIANCHFRLFFSNIFLF